MTAVLDEMLAEQDARDLHGAGRPAARVNHLSLSPRTVREVFDAVAALRRPAFRSGHVGNWKEIWNGQVGLVDYNRYICRDFELGVPVLHAHTFTENRDLSDGDTIYLPAGRIEDSAYRRLTVFVKDGTAYRPVPDSESVCCAFAYVEEHGSMIPLLEARADETSGIAGATTIPTVLTRDEGLLRRALQALLDAAKSEDSALTLDQVFGSSVSRQGRRGAAPQPSGSGFVVEGTRYETDSALVEAAVEALRFGSAEGDGGVRDRAQPSGEFLPLLGAAAVLVLAAYWDCHAAGDGGVHVHWGAISMSGYPPLSQGYFGRRATRKCVRLLGEGLRSVPELAFDLQFALLPAPLLSLLPPAEFESDCARVEQLLDRVLTSTEAPGADPGVAQEQISEVVRAWLVANSTSLTRYYLNRFGLARSVHNGTRDVPGDGRPAELGRLAELTMQQGSMVLGALMTHTKAVCGGGA